MSQTNFIPKAESVAIPKGGIALVLAPGQVEGDYTFFGLTMTHNFANDIKSLSNEDKSLFILANGLVAIATRRSDMVLEAGNNVLSKYIDTLIKEQPKKLEDMPPQGSC